MKIIRRSNYARFLFLALGFSGIAEAQSNYATPYYFSTMAGTAGGPGEADGVSSDARFNAPAVDAAGNVYVADTGNHTIRKITPSQVVTTIAGSAGNPGSTDGTGSGARFNSTQGVAVDATGNIYVADTANSMIRKITPAGIGTTLAGSAGIPGVLFDETHANDGTGSAARFISPVSIALDTAGNIYVVDLLMALRKITPAGEIGPGQGARRYLAN